MKTKREGLLFLARGGLELSWLYAWTTFIMISILHRSFPLPEAIGTFALAAVLTMIIRGRGWRVFWVLGLQVFGLLLAASRIVYLLLYASLLSLANCGCWSASGNRKIPWGGLSSVLSFSLPSYFGSEG